MSSRVSLLKNNKNEIFLGVFKIEGNTNFHRRKIDDTCLFSDISMVIELSTIQLEEDEIAWCSNDAYLRVEFDTTWKDDREIKDSIIQARKLTSC